MRTIGGNEDKTIGTIPLTYRSSSSASLKLGNFTFGKLSHILLHQSSSFSKVENARAKQLHTNSKHFDPDEFSSCCCEKPSTRSPLISPLIRFSRHSTSGNSLSFCPDPQRLGEETSRFFFGINALDFQSLLITHLVSCTIFSPKNKRHL